MMIELPDGERIDLDNNIDLQEKINCVNELIEKYGDVICDGWHSTKIKFFLNGLSNYICWHKEEIYTQDKEILSRAKTLRMKTYDPKNINFSALNYVDKCNLGLISEPDSYIEQ